MMDRITEVNRFVRLAGRSRCALLTATVALMPVLGARSAKGGDVSTLNLAGDAPQPRSGLPPFPKVDQIFLISTRAMGTRCDADSMPAGLRCERLAGDPRRGGPWRQLSWHDLLEEFTAPLPTVVYVHGNRVASGVDKSHGLQFYRALAIHKKSPWPLRFVIWSWPSEQIRGPVKDYQVKAARTRPAGWQLAWAVDQWSAETSVALVGYSYGARVVTGALHLLGGGQIGNLKLASRAHPDRRPLRAALVAAALDADWLRRGGYNGLAITQVDSLLLVNNQLDPAMRFYPLSPVGRRAPALGYAGPTGRDSLGELAARIRSYDVTSAVGRHHDLTDYLTSSAQVGRVLEKILDLAPGNPAPQDAALADHPKLAGRQ
jgi:hypothetical protein